MVAQDIKKNIEVVYEGHNKIIVGTVEQTPFVYRGTRVAVIRAKDGHIYYADVHHIHLVDELRGL